MIKKIKLTFALALCLATAALAQQPQTQPMRPSDGNKAENTFAFSVHPISMIYNYVVFEKPGVYLTFENAINSNLSIITRPFYLGAELTDKSESIDLNMYGLSEGARFYFFRGHQGLFTAFHVEYEYIDIDYSYSDTRDRYRDEKSSCTGNGIGIAFYVGSKSLWGHLTTSWDIGVTYMSAYVKSKSKDDVDELTSVGVGFDINYTIGFAL